MKHFKYFVAFVLLFASVLVVNAQNYVVNGIVIDNTKSPIPGVTVWEEGAPNGHITDVDGRFNLSTQSEHSVIVISFIGYQTQKMTASQLAQMGTVIMKDDNILLDDIVIIGYGSVKKNDLTGSVTAIKAEELNRGAITSPDQMLQGKVPGLLVTPASGDPTGSARIRIRGAASLYASNDPLIVIDGVPVTSDGGAGMANPLASVNPSDIESYTVLKDASATAIYGSRASNGVILITTKKGVGDKMQVSYNSSYSLKQNTETLDVMTGSQLRDFIAKTYAGSNQLASIQSLMGEADTNWQDLIYRTAFSTDQNASIYGKTGNLPYRVSLGYNYNEATLKKGNNQRVNMSFSLNPKLFKEHLSININAKGIYNRADYPNTGAVGSAISFDPTQNPYFLDTQGNIDTSKSNGYFNWLTADGAANTQANYNPLSQLYENYNVNHTWRSMGNLQLDYKIHGFEDLRLNLNLGYDLARTEGTRYAELGSFLSMRNTTNDYYTKYSRNNANTLLEFYGNYNKELGIHHLDIMGGYSWQHNYVKDNNIDYYNAERDKVHLDSPTDRREYYLLSFFGRINYSINSKYLFTFSLRDDASSRFSKNNRWGLFPSAAFAWNISEESFLQNSKLLSKLKLRLGWGKTGQQDIGMDRCYAYLPKYTSSTGMETMILWGNDYLQTLAPNAYNKNIKWETTETYNLGIDFGFFQGRINGSIDGYLRKTKDLLNEIATPLGSNFSNTVIANVGNMENKGVELNLNFVPIEKKEMRWTINLNGTWQDTKITQLTNNNRDEYLGVQVGTTMGANEGYSSLYRVGCAPYTYHLYKQAYDTDGKPLQNVLIDMDENGRITESDRYVTDKSMTPKFFFGIGSQFVYKQWDLGFNAHGSLGGYALNKVRMGGSTSYSDSYTKGFLSNLQTYCLETGWTTSRIEAQRVSDMFLENASFFRMDDINIGYTFKKFSSWKGEIRLGASVQNVFTITKYKGIDPELTAVDGVDGNIVPRPRLYSFRLNINF